MVAKWSRGVREIVIGTEFVTLPLPLYRLCELSSEFACVVLEFERSTPESQANALIYSTTGAFVKDIVIKDGGWPLRFVECSVEDSLLCLWGENQFLYYLEIGTWIVVEKKYYR